MRVKTKIKDKKRKNASFICFQCIMLSYTANINARQRLESSHGMMHFGISCKVDEVRSIVEGVMVVVNRDEKG